MDGLDNLKSNFKKFDGTDFGLQKDKVQAALKATKCVEAIKNEFKLTAEDEDQDKEEKERKNEDTDDKAEFILMSCSKQLPTRQRIYKTSPVDLCTQGGSAPQ